MNGHALISSEQVKQVIEKYQITDLSKATIREIVAIVNDLEAISGVPFIRMEMGVPGLPPSEVGIQAEIEALKNGVASQYPMLDGLDSLKKEASRFIKAFMDLTIDPKGCIATVGSMQGSYAAFLMAGLMHETRDTILFIDPGFPVQKQQIKVLGYKYESFDVYKYRGERLREKLESFLIKNNIAAIVYSNPNNPTWICLNDQELQIIGELSKKYDVTIIEDLAYFGMDFRRDIGTPFQPPYQVSVGNYTDNYILLISSSKAFSYAGQRMAVMCVSDALYHRQFSNLKAHFGVAEFGTALVQRVLYALSSGASHSAQYALAAIFKAASDGKYQFLSEVKEYEIRAHEMKSLFLSNGFDIVYDHDLEESLADGFYFSIGYNGFTGGKLLLELLSYGISAITLDNTGSLREGLRACVSQTSRVRFPELERRLGAFANDHQ